MSKQFKRDLLVFALLFGVLTLPFLFFDLDIALQKPYYSTSKGWFMGDWPFWHFIYKYGIFLGYLLAFAALIVVSLSYWKKALVIWRKAALFMLLIVIVGPGILVNGTFKDHWGRPRPREIVQFDGVEQYHKVWVKGDTGGKSFPCGHASMGFFMALPFLFLRKRYRGWAWTFFIFGTLYGLLIGYARMIAGGHFASDVLWAAGMVWLPAIILFHLLKIDEPLKPEDFDAAKQKRKGKVVSLVLGLFLPVLTVGLLLATPYISKKQFTRNQTELQNLAPKLLKVSFDEGVVTLSFDTLFAVNYAVNGFGFPNSKIGLNWAAGDTSHFWLAKTGWFTEVRNQINLIMPQNTAWQNQLFLEEGKIYVDIPTDTLPTNLSIKVKKGDVYLRLASGAKLNLDHQVPEWVNQTEGGNIYDNNHPIKIKVVIGEGKLVVEAQNR
jgi:membrane-associated PAP2 superfamily phosphatase